MNQKIETFMRQLVKNRQRRRKALFVLTVLSFFVAGSVIWQLRLTGITLSNDTHCGIEAHQHDESCYTKTLICGYEEGETQTVEKMLQCTINEHLHSDACFDEQAVLVCGEGHSHSAECYTQDRSLVCTDCEDGHEHGEGCYEVTSVLTCTLDDAHVHSDACYEIQTILVCNEMEHTHLDTCWETPIAETGADAHLHTDECYEITYSCDLEEHLHTSECYSDPSADVETAAGWEASLPDTLTGNWAEDLLAVAKSQIGYTESSRNYAVTEDGELKGYTRYGAWYGNPYGDWEAMFVSFCLHYAQLPEEAAPVNSGVEALRAEWENLGLCERKNYTPAPGDLVFLDLDENGKADQVGIVTKLSEAEETLIFAISGNVSDSVTEEEYRQDDVLCYGSISSAYARAVELGLTETGDSAEAADTAEETCTCGAAEGEHHTEDCPLYVTPECTCGAAEGDAHAEDCPLHEAPECTCGAEGLFHASECLLYSEPITADVYAEENGVYTLLEAHDSGDPLNMSAYHEKTLYILANSGPQELYFMASGYFESGVAFSVSESEYALLTSGKDKFTNHTARLTVAGDTPAGTEFTLSAKGLIVTSYTVTVKVLDKLPVVQIPLDITQASEESKSEVEAVLADVLPERPENSTRSTWYFAIEPTEDHVEGVPVEVVVPLGLSPADNVQVSVNVYHMADDGTLKEVLTGNLDENGDVVFTTTSFSDFYFTVDFTYGGSTVSFDVGGDITLSLLMAMLGVDQGIREVADVTITGDAAQYVLLEKLEFPDEYDTGTGDLTSPGYTDYQISNEEPFTVEGILRITFRDGTTADILVTDDEVKGATISQNTTWELKENRNISDTITINAKLTIKASGADRTINRNTQWIMFKINAGGELSIAKNGSYDITLDGKDFEPKYENDNGRKLTYVGIWCEGKLTLSDVTIQNFTRRGSIQSDTDGFGVLGGAIYFINVTENCTLTRVRIQNCSSCNGSAVCFGNNDDNHRSDTPKFTFTSCTFNNNSTCTNHASAAGKHVGGTFRSLGGAVGDVTLKNCNIRDNTSGWNGAGIYWNAAGTTATKLTIDGCNIYNNKANQCTNNTSKTGSGGGCMLESIVTITGDTKIYTNEAYNGGGIDLPTYAGGWNTYGGTGNMVTMANTVQIYSNTATNNGGGIWLNVKDSADVGTNPDGTTITTVNFGLTLNGCTIKDNKAGKNGGGIYLENISTKSSYGKNYYAKVTVNSGTTISGNTAANFGGGIYISDGSSVAHPTVLSISGTFSGNTAKSGGGAYLTGAGTINLVSGTVTKNTASLDGGGICTSGTAKVNITGGSVTENNAQYGGGITAAGGGTVTMSGGSVKNNTASVNGGGLCVNNCTMTYSAGYVSYNTAANGGGVYVTNGGKLTMSGGFITYNDAVGTCSLTTTYQKKSTDGLAGSGGGVFLASGTSTSKRSTFTLTGSNIGIYGNEASFSGDDVVANGSDTYLDIPDVANMNLSGLSYHVDGWFEDYSTKDVSYNVGTNKKSLSTGANDLVQRYRWASANKPELVELVKIDSTFDKNGYACLTLGIDRGGLTVKKTVEGITTTQHFSFTVQVTPAEGSAWSAANFSLKHGEQKVFTGIPTQAKITIKETDAPGFSTTVKLHFYDGTTQTLTPNASGVYTVTTSFETLKISYVEVINTSGYQLPETGGVGTTLYTMGGLLLMAAAVLLLYSKTKRRKEDYLSS